MIILTLLGSHLDLDLIIISSKQSKYSNIFSVYNRSNNRCSGTRFTPHILILFVNLNELIWSSVERKKLPARLPKGCCNTWISLIKRLCDSYVLIHKHPKSQYPVNFYVQICEVIHLLHCILHKQKDVSLIQVVTT